MKSDFKKRIISAVAVFAMLSSSISFAADDTGIKKTAVTGSRSLTLNMNNIEQIMLERSPAVKKIKNDTWTTQQKYEDIDDSISDVQDQISALVSQKGPDGKPADNSAQIAALYAQINSLSSTQTQLRLASDTSEATLSQQVNAQILKAKQLFTSCLADEDSLLVTDAEYLQKQKELAVATEKLKRGYISQNAYERIVNATEGMDANLRTQESQKEANLRDLKILLGVDKDTTLLLEAVDISDFELSMIENLNFSSDLDTLMNASATIKSAQISYDTKSSGDGYNDYDENSAQANLKTSKETVSANFKKQYDSLMNSYKSLKVSKEKLKSQVKTYEIEKKKLEKGYISETSFVNTEIATKNLINQVNTEENLLYVSLLSYRQTRTGN